MSPSPRIQPRRSCGSFVSWYRQVNSGAVFFFFFVFTSPDHTRRMLVSVCIHHPHIHKCIHWIHTHTLAHFQASRWLIHAQTYASHTMHTQTHNIVSLRRACPHTDSANSIIRLCLFPSSGCGKGTCLSLLAGVFRLFTETLRPAVAIFVVIGARHVSVDLSIMSV